MQFELTEALLDDILFSMEDQEGNFYIDCQEGVVVIGEEIDEDLIGDQFIFLPEWDSSSGFRLMERFAAAFKNPLIRNELCAALNQGKGVFRAFKNALSLHPEAEKLWFSFKEREMKREIIRWYNALREEWGLKKIGFEPEETSDLVLEDFRFRDFTAEDEVEAAELHKLCVKSADGSFPEEGKNENAGRTIALVAESASEDFAGYISAAQKDDALFINILEVKPEFRGLGIGKALLGHLLKKVKTLNISKLFIGLPVDAEGFSRALIREGFTPCMTQYAYRMED